MTQWQCWAPFSSAPWSARRRTTGATIPSFEAATNMLYVETWAICGIVCYLKSFLSALPAAMTVLISKDPTITLKPRIFPFWASEGGVPGHSCWVQPETCSSCLACLRVSQKRGYSHSPQVGFTKGISRRKILRNSMSRMPRKPLIGSAARGASCGPYIRLSPALSLLPSDMPCVKTVLTYGHLQSDPPSSPV